MSSEAVRSTGWWSPLSSPGFPSSLEAPVEHFYGLLGAGHFSLDDVPPIKAVADLTNLRTLNWCSCNIRPVIRLSFVWRREINVAFFSVWGICYILELKYLICRLFASFRSKKNRQYLQHLVFTNFPIVFNDVWMVFMDFLMIFSSCFCRILALQTLIWMVFATCWCFKRSRGFI